MWKEFLMPWIILQSGLVVGSTHSLEVYFFNLNFHSKSQFKFYIKFYYD